jgi:hypothetical protein
MDWLSWIGETGLAVWMRESSWGYPTVLSFHAIGMAIVAGIVMMLSLRALGYARQLPMKFFDSLYTVGWLGFLVNSISGVLLILIDPVTLLANTFFILKIILIVLGGLALRILGRSFDQVDKFDELPPSMRGLASISLCLWLGVIIAGRLIAYTN